MSNLLSSLSSVANSMKTYEKAMEVVQNDTVNSNTQGFAAQNVNFSALQFDINGTAGGGVAVGSVLSARDEYAEHNVQLQQTSYNYSSTLATDLSNVQPLFDPQNTTGVAGSLNTLFAAFSQLATTPNDTTARQTVINDASGVANAFNSTASGLANAVSTISTSAQNTLTTINNTLADVAKLNSQISAGSHSTPDPGLEARMYSDLETLSQYVGIQTQVAADGTINVSLAGQRPLVVGSTSFPLSMSSTASSIVIKDSSGNDITSFVHGGQLGAQIDLRNTILPGYQSQLNQLAKNVADAINTQLASGVDQSNNPGAALFSYGAGDEAQSLSVTGITSGQIAAASAGNPGGNDNALALSALQNSTIGGLGNATITNYFAALSAQVGRDVSNSQNDHTTGQSLLAQAQSLRSQSSAVSLDSEAAKLEQYQMSYSATSKLITIIDQMTETLMSIFPAR
ncbi:MAG TPA: flagellar hook-associated protein FlgK [Bryobacteraceae bacterium]|nr:flagellar hook-associated protein FlgK [Bryobacteraceae bacterium]